MIGQALIDLKKKNNKNTYEQLSTHYDLLSTTVDSRYLELAYLE